MTLHKNNIKREYAALQSLQKMHICNHKKAKKWCKIIPYKESDNIAVVVVFIDTKRSRLTYESYSTYKHIYV